MKKSFYAFALLVLCILFTSMYYIKTHSSTDSPEMTLIKSFGNSGAQVVNSEIYFWSKVDNTYNDFEELKRLVENIADGLGVLKDSNFSEDIIRNDLMDKQEIKGVMDNDQVVSLNVRIDKKGKESVERVVFGTITRDLSNDWLEDTSKKLTQVLRRYGISAELNTCIVGSYEGLLDDDRLDDIAKDILKGAEAKKIEGIRDDKLISVSAYSPSISDSIKVNGKKVNLNLAIRYNSNENKTYIWLATPVITKEY